MKNENQREWTIDIVKKERKAPDSLQDQMKEFNKIQRSILNSIKSEYKTIPQISKEIELAVDTTTYYVMTLLKYGKIEVGDLDDMDEYYYYKKKEN